MNFIFISTGTDDACERRFIKYRELIPDIKRIHGVQDPCIALSICAAISDTPFFCVVNGDQDILPEVSTIQIIADAEHEINFDLPQNLNIVRAASIKSLNEIPQKIINKEDGFDIVYLTYDEPLIDENFISIKKKYPRAMRLHRVTGMAKAFATSAYLATTSWYILIDGDNILLPNTDLNNIKAPSQDIDYRLNKIVLIHGARNGVNDLEYCYGGIKLCPTLWFRNITSDVIDPIYSNGTITLFDPKNVLSITNFNNSAYGAWKAGFREAVMLATSCLLNSDKNEHSIWRNKYLDIWKTQGENRPYGLYCMYGAREGYEFAKVHFNSISSDLTNKELKLLLVDKLQIINNPNWLRSRFDKCNLEQSNIKNITQNTSNNSMGYFPIRLCTVVGDNVDMLQHFIEHYRKLGVDEFHIILQVNKYNEEFYQQALDILSMNGLKPAFVYRGDWSGKIVTDLINQIKSEFSDDWFVIADSDELHVHPFPLCEQISQIISIETTYITGCFVDRVSLNGTLQPILSNLSIWEQFPNAGFVSFPLSGAMPYKITICRGHIELALGQHGVIINNSQYPVRSEVQTQVHHFKWNQRLLTSLEKRQKQFMESLSSLYYGDKAYLTECDKVLSYLRSNNGIRINDPVFLISKSGNNYTDYQYWAEILKITKSWKILQSSQKVTTQNIKDNKPYI